MTPVEERLVRRIALTGPLSVADFMSACLTDPDGYYARQTPFGAEGDFVTAPEISQMFGELVGAWLVHAWIMDGRPAPFDLVELGPGRGTLMADILRVAGAHADFADAANIVLVEASEGLRAEQRRRLAPLHPRLRWAERPVADRPIYLVANEFFDALPIRQFVHKAGAWFERTVGLADENREEKGEDAALTLGLSPFPTPFAPRPGEQPPEGAVREVRPAADTMIAEIAAGLSVHGQGAALIIDYGHEAEGYAETLQAVRRHQPVEILHRPGEVDLSAHVDFAALSAAARTAGVHAHGPVNQGPFLLALGLAERAGQLGASASEAEREAIRSAAHRLAGNRDGEMGDLFKVLALTPENTPLPGFPRD